MKKIRISIGNYQFVAQLYASEFAKLAELGYWPDGPAFCIFFRPTPVSIDKRPKAISPVNLFGKLEGSLDKLHQIKDGELMRIEAF